MSSLGDAFRPIAMQHLAAGGSAEDLHDGIHGVLGAAPSPTGAIMVGGATDPINHFAAPAGRVWKQPEEITAAQMARVAAAPPAAPPSVSSSLPPDAAPLPGPPGATDALQNASALGRVAANGAFGPDPGYEAGAFSALNRSSGHERLMLEANRDFGKAADLEGQGKADELRLRGEQAEAEAPIREKQAAEAQKYADRINELEQAGQQRIQAQMARYQSASDAAAQTEIHNFFDDKTTGASIMAIISQALSGAANGLAGNPGAPTPLDRIIQQDIERQKMNMDQKNRAADRQGTMLGVLRDELGSQTLAESAMYQASLTKTEAMIKQLAPYHAGGINSALAQQALAAVQEKKAASAQQAQGFAAQHDLTQGDTLAHIAEAREASKGAMFAALAKASGKEQQNFSTKGIIGDIPKALIDKQAADAKNTASMNSALRRLEGLVHGGASYDEMQKYISNTPVFQDIAHKRGFTRPGQMKDFVEEILPGYVKGQSNITGAADRIHETRKNFIDEYLQGSLALSHGLRPDFEDPDFGDLYKEIANDRARAEGK